MSRLSDAWNGWLEGVIRGALSGGKAAGEAEAMAGVMTRLAPPYALRFATTEGEADAAARETPVSVLGGLGRGWRFKYSRTPEPLDHSFSPWRNGTLLELLRLLRDGEAQGAQAAPPPYYFDGVLEGAQQVLPSFTNLGVESHCCTSLAR